jgi:molybdate transport system substrate-binding protein
VRPASWLAAAALAVSVGAAAQEPAKVYAAGSLRAVLTEAARVFEVGGGGKVAFEFGPSGLLRGRLAKGERADVFASANMEHPQSLAASGKAGPVRMFARNRLCALARPQAGVTSGNLLDRMLDPAVKLGTSTPKADPSGDYAWKLFERAEAVKPGARAALERKALQLTGGPSSPPPPKDRSVYGMLVAKAEADIFLTYCTNAVIARKEEPALQVVAVPEALAVGADYGLAVMQGASRGGQAFASFLLDSRGQALLAAAGFAPPSP